MGTNKNLFEPDYTSLNLGLSCLIANGSFVQSSFNDSSRVPCTTSCVSRLIDLKRLRHPSLARYLDAQCDKHRRIYLVTEHYCSDFSQLNPPIRSISDFNFILNRFEECLQGLSYLETNGIVIGNLNPSSLLLDNRGHIKITNYGTFYASRWGLDLDFPVVDLKYSSPEVLLYVASCEKLTPNDLTVEPSCTLDSRSDLWSLALIFAEILHFPIKPFTTQSLLQSLFKSLNSNHSFFEQIIQSSDFPDLEQLSGRIEILDNILKSCLILDALRRSHLSEVQSLFLELIHDLEVVSFDNPNETLEVKEIENEYNEGHEKAHRFLRSRDDPAESYYYWQLAGGGIDLAATFLKGVNGSDYLRPPILRLPIFFMALSPLHGGPIEVWSPSNQPTRLKFCPSIVPLPAERLLKRLDLMLTSSLYPLLFPHTYSCQSNGSLQESMELTGLEECWNSDPTPSDHLPKHELTVAKTFDAMAFQPVLVKQADVEYQVMRVCLIRRLLRGMPATATRLLLEARFDIPPFLRAEVWSALLGVESGYSDDMDRQKIEAALSRASAIQPLSSSPGSPKSSPKIFTGLSDQVMGQISVDLPRCHAYDLLIGSPLGQHRLRSVLVAALLANEDRFEYTQGMDSLAAVFTRLFFPDPTTATHCLSNLLTSPRLVNFFARRRFTAGLQAYFCTLLRLLAFHVPAVAAHFARLGVPLTGLTAGWMYTLFAHSMPLNRTEILWDRLLASPSPIPMLVYVAVFHQVNQQCRLLKMNQENICTLLSNFPDFNLDQCLEDALNFSSATPISLTTTAQQQLQEEVSPQNGDGCSDDGWMNHLTRSLHQFNLTHAKMLSTYADSNMGKRGARHQRGHCLTCLSSWPTHMDAVTPSRSTSSSTNTTNSTEAKSKQGQGQRQQQTPAHSPGIAFNRSDIDYRRVGTSLVPLIDPADALQQLSRTDVVLVDMRSKEDYTRGCLMQSIHYTFMHEIEAGVIYLTSSQVWFEATAVRNTTNPRGATGTGNAHSPGLVMILQRTTSSPEELHDAASALACCLIQQAIDRVCVIRGGARALFSLPQITDYFVSPRT